MEYVYCILIYSNELHCTGTMINFLLKKYTTFCLWISWTHLRLVRVRQRAHLLSFYALSRANMTSFTNRKYCRCRNAARKCTRHGHRQRARKLDEHLTCRFRDMQADRHVNTERLTWVGFIHGSGSIGLGWVDPWVVLGCVHPWIGLDWVWLGPTK